MPEAQSWLANAAYLYTLLLDRPALTWEYLRRNPDYQNDWRRSTSREPGFPEKQAQTWGLRFLREP